MVTAFLLLAPPGTPTAFIESFGLAMAKVLQMPDIRESLTKRGLTVQHMTPTQLGQRDRAYTQTWKAMIKHSGFKPQ
jgi:tripartite-type tricarboxylate transporter receptor subunit TctC